MAQATTGRLAPRAVSVRADRGTWIVLVVLAFALRAWGLVAQSLWSDEDISLDRARLPLAELLSALPVEHAPGYFVLLRGWTRLAGDGDLSLRAPSLAAGVLAVVLGGYVASHLVGRRAGLVTGLLLAVNPFLVWYGQEARMYTLLAAASLGALACVLRAEAAERPWRWWVAAGAMTAVTVYIHYYGALLVLTLVAWGLLDLARRGRAAIKGWLLAGATAFVLFVPWLPRALAALSFPGGRAFLFQGDVFAVAAAWSAGTTLAPEWSAPIRWLYLALAVVGILALLWSARMRRNEGAWRALLYLAIPLAAMALLVVRTQDFHPRYYFAALPAVYLVVAAGVAALPRPLRIAAAGLLALASLPALAGLHTDPRFQKQDYRAFLRTVEAAAGHEDTVLFLDGPSLGLARRYEVEDSAVKIVNIRQEQGVPPPEKVAERAAELAAEYPHLWLAENGEANEDIGRWLDERACKVAEEAFQDVTLRRYFAASGWQWEEPDLAQLGGSLHALPSSPANDLPPERGAQIRPAIVWNAAERVSAGQVLPLRVGWSRWGNEAIPQTLGLSIRLVPDGPPAAPPVVMVDQSPFHGRLPASGWQPGDLRWDCHGLWIPLATPAGRYRVDLVLYDAESGRELDRWTGPVLTVEPPP